MARRVWRTNVLTCQKSHFALPHAAILFRGLSALYASAFLISFSKDSGWANDYWHLQFSPSFKIDWWLRL